MSTLLHDDVVLAYEEAGDGAPPLLFVHGLACDRSYFAPQVEHFSRTHRTIAVDLRGHGESDRPEQAYTMDALAADLAWLCDQLRVEKPVVVGHSMGGIVGLVLAAQHPDLPSAVVMVDMPTAALNGPPQESDPRVRILDGVRGPDYHQNARRFVAGMFLPTDDSERKARIVEGMTSAPQYVFCSVLEHVWSVDLVAAVVGCTVPTLYIQAASPRPELDRLAELCPTLVVGRTVGAGHFNMLEVPDQVNAMLARFLVISGVCTSS